MLEQFPPREAVELAAHAAQRGFDGTMAGDRFQPWLPQQGQASHLWSVLSAIGAVTPGELGGVAVPGFRAHPAAVAQASATLAALYPGRHWLGVAGGDAIDEHVVGEYWPEAPERINRMFEAVDVIRKLFASGLAQRDVKHDGRWYHLESTRLWTMPPVAPEVLIATAGPVTAKRAGKVADGLITEQAEPERLAHLLQKLDEGAREAGRDPRTLTRVLRLHVSWAPTQDEALANALHEWPTLGLRFNRSELRSPHDVAQLSKLVRADDLAGQVLVSADLDEHRAHVASFLALGFDRIYLHNVGRNQREWIDAYGESVLPGLIA